MLSIYLSDDRIKLIDGQIKGKKFYIKKFAEVATNVGSIESGNIKDVLAFTQAVQGLMNDNGIKPQKKVVVVLDNSRIVFREQEVPALPEKKLKVILVSDLFSDAKSKNYVVDYVVDEKIKGEDKKFKYRIHLTYQTSDAIASIAKGVNELNMKCLSIDVAQNAMSKLITDTAALKGLNLLIDYENTFISL
jgi:Tfp pilus assembly PilM family ATPase